MADIIFLPPKGTPRSTILAEAEGVLGREKLERLTGVILKLVLDEVKEGLGLTFSHRDTFPMFDQIQTLYDESDRKMQCYLCSPDIDACDEPYTAKSRLCPGCQQRVGNMLRAFGLAPERIFPFTAPAAVQEGTSLLSTGINPWATTM